jgi:flavin-dependent dehydrogenase
MATTFDVVVVGARCAGAPLATLLARQGVEVALVERATFPRDTLSTHVFEADGIAFLDRLGVMERLRDTGAPFVCRVDNRIEGFRAVIGWPLRPGDRGGLMSVRRFLLDPILVDTAEQAGAKVFMGTNVTGLIEECGRVAGVQVAGNGDGEFRARLVVGADGRNSTVAGLRGARKYNVAPNERALYWTFFEDADLGDEPTFVFHRWADRLVVASPADSGLYQVLVLPEVAELDRFRSNLDESFMEHALSCEPVAKAIAGARRVGKFFGMVRWLGFFRDAAGPGWVLVGDAAHFKDPTPGRGISDAFRQADALAPAIVKGLAGSAADLDTAMAEWGCWRDREFASYYWFGTTMGKAGPLPAVGPELTARLHAQGKLREIFEIQNHRTRPEQVLTPARLLSTTAQMLARRGTARRALLREVASLVADDVRQRRLNRRPVFAAPSTAARDAGPTEIEDNAAAPIAG